MEEVITCNICGTRNIYREYGMIFSGDTIIQIKKCACGRTHQQTIWAKSVVANWEDGQIISQHKIEKNA